MDEIHKMLGTQPDQSLTELEPLSPTPIPSPGINEESLRAQIEALKAQLASFEASRENISPGCDSPSSVPPPNPEPKPIMPTVISVITPEELSPRIQPVEPVPPPSPIKYSPTEDSLSSKASTPRVQTALITETSPVDASSAISTSEKLTSISQPEQPVVSQPEPVSQPTTPMPEQRTNISDHPATPLAPAILQEVDVSSITLVEPQYQEAGVQTECQHVPEKTAVQPVEVSIQTELVGEQVSFPVTAQVAISSDVPSYVKPQNIFLETSAQTEILLTHEIDVQTMEDEEVFSLSCVFLLCSENSK